MTVARRWSCRALARISDPEAEPPLIKLTIGSPCARSPGLAVNRALDSDFRPRTETIKPLSRKSSATATAWSSNPPRIVAQIEHNPFEGKTGTGAHFV